MDQAESKKTMWNNKDLRHFYGQLKKNGPYGIFAPQNKGGPKSQYIATLFNEATIPYFKDATRDKVLDLGCGTGVLSNELARIGQHVVGVDISSDLLDFAKRTAPALDRQTLYIQIDGKILPFKDSYFNSVVARESLCNVLDEDFPGILAEVNRVLCKNGHFYLLEQTSESPYWRTQGDFSIRRSIDEIMEKTRSAGFECIEARVVRKPRFPWIYLFWFGLLPKKLIRPLARLEIEFNKLFFGLKTNRWHDALFIFRKVI